MKKKTELQLDRLGRLAYDTEGRFYVYGKIGELYQWFKVLRLHIPRKENEKEER